MSGIFDPTIFDGTALFDTGVVIPAVVPQPATQSAGAGHGPLRDRSRDKRKPDEYYEIYQQKVNKRHAKRVNAQIRQAAIEDEDYDYLLLAA